MAKAGIIVFLFDPSSKRGGNKYDPIAFFVLYFSERIIEYFFKKWDLTLSANVYNIMN